MKLADIQTGSFQERPTPRGVAWTAELKVDGKTIATAHHAGRGGCVAYYPKTLTMKEWQPIFETLEAEARKALDTDFEALDLLLSCAEPNQSLTDALKTYNTLKEQGYVQ